MRQVVVRTALLRIVEDAAYSGWVSHQGLPCLDHFYDSNVRTNRHCILSLTDQPNYCGWWGRVVARNRRACHLPERDSRLTSLPASNFSSPCPPLVTSSRPGDWTSPSRKPFLSAGLFNPCNHLPQQCMTAGSSSLWSRQPRQDTKRRERLLLLATVKKWPYAAWSICSEDRLLDFFRPTGS